MSRQNLNELQGDGNENNEDHLQYGWRNTRRRTSYKHRGTSSLTPAQVMDQDTYYGYAWMSLVQGMYMFHLVLLHLASVKCFSRRVDRQLECTKKQYTEVEYVTLKTKWFTNYYELQFCLVDVWLSVVYFANAPSQLV